MRKVVGQNKKHLITRVTDGENDVYKGLISTCGNHEFMIWKEGIRFQLCSGGVIGGNYIGPSFAKGYIAGNVTICRYVCRLLISGEKVLEFFSYRSRHAKIGGPSSKVVLDMLVFGENDINDCRTGLCGAIRNGRHSNR